MHKNSGRATAKGNKTHRRLGLGRRALVRRCLLAMRESKGFKKFGCSSEIHYATAKLGMNKRAARECRRVARSLLHLPKLTWAAENGLIDWSMLREIVGKAVVETEDYWLKLAKELDCDQVEKLVSKTPKGGVPGDVFEEPEQPTSELRCKLSEEVLAMLDHARRLHSVEQGEAVTTAQVLEFALVSYISNKRICFNPQNRHTIDRNLVGLCCHRNVHDGSLRIFLHPDGKLHFTDAEGNSVAEQADLELGQWLDFNIGWDGEEDDSFTIRAHRGEWSVFGEAQIPIS